MLLVFDAFLGRQGWLVLWLTRRFRHGCSACRKEISENDGALLHPGEKSLEIVLLFLVKRLSFDLVMGAGISIDVAQVALFSFELSYEIRRTVRAQAARLLGHAKQGSVHVLSHALRIAADVEARAILQPSPQLSGLLEHAVLHVDLLLLVPGEGQIEAGESSIGLHGMQFFTIEKIALRTLVTEEEPVLARGSGRAPFLKEGRKGAMPVPGPTMITGRDRSAGRRKDGDL